MYILQSAKADVEINITTEILPSINSNNIVLPWKLVRIDIQQLNVKVGHHFDFEEDGHERSYNQHVKSENKTQYNVYLVRETDQFVIPFGNVNAITVIALLRMGLIEQQIELCYKKFLHLPLYEDMATWNIVFRHGNLEYIDFDTKNTFYDKIVPSAAQIIAVLINYKRTLLDLDKCGEKAETSLGFNYISECVGSEFNGPCPDLAYQVPCGDHTCRSSYIDCLQALLAYNKHPEVKGKSLHQDKYSQWSFNKLGAIKRKNKLI
ncbi:hypothetical protein LOTGIDRAFT_151993 [Lottia gigantea]|uniref:Uncharacterized protein n=1 Tax=Lottia gigantea TaxID=225164 RepID=V4BC29_LOTGI|nr:hypothetical protein LOTGIDRAFT_151993 [Lottia gigantea]ESP05186.1 hypothetical protein LOTGIDRAFT_151993 [Lottia gigantea]